jgi:hypothetical protein
MLTSIESGAEQSFDFFVSKGSEIGFKDKV